MMIMQPSVLLKLLAWELPGIRQCCSTGSMIVFKAHPFMVAATLRNSCQYALQMQTLIMMAVLDNDICP